VVCVCQVLCAIAVGATSSECFVVVIVVAVLINGPPTHSMEAPD